MKIWIVLTLVVELFVGLLLLTFPELAPQLKGAEGAGLTMARIYGAAAITVAIMCFWTLKNFKNEAIVSVFLHVIIAFQFLVVMASVLSYVKGETVDPGPIILHSVFLIGYIFFYFKRK